jgi:hypothetical protein
MNRDSRQAIELSLVAKRASLGRFYHVDCVECVHCMEDLLYWRYSDGMHHKWRLDTCSYIPDILMDLKTSVNAVRLFHFIGGLVLYNNVSYFNREDACAICGIDERAFRRCYSELQVSGLIKDVPNRLAKVSDKLVLVAPAAYWNGDYATRYACMNRWYIGVGTNPDLV